MGNVTRRILIVDDEPSLLKMMSTYLSRLGYGVLTVTAKEQAWREVQADPMGFAAVVLDASMPGMSLNELALGMLAANPELRVIAASGYPVDMTALEAAAPARVLFLHKPFSPEMLAQAVRRMLAPQAEV